MTNLASPLPKYELESQFTKDQIVWLEDQLTSILLHIAFVEKEINKIKNHLSGVLKDVKQHSGKGGDKE
uniref:Uncharacterized protein n=1 Tax=viral metagenome TaxID=1070528 RepID=A0A6M3KXY0_9ZZZZ